MTESSSNPSGSPGNPMGDEGQAQRAVLLAEALKALRRGWQLTPLRGKKPVLIKWSSRQPTSEREVRAWVTGGHNLGIRTGRISGVVAIDDDTEGGGGARALGLPRTVTSVTGRDRRHHLFVAPDAPLGNSVSKIHQRVDVRGDGGQIVLVGSIHPDTHQPYRWLDGHSPDEIELAPFPLHLLDRLRDERGSDDCGTTPGSASRDDAPLERYLNGVLRRAIADVATASEGRRNNSLNKAAFNLGRFVGAGLIDRPRVEGALEAAALAVGLSAREAQATIASGLAAGIREPIDVNELLGKLTKSASGAQESARSEEREQPAEMPTRHVVDIKGGDLPSVVDRAELALLESSGDPLFQRGDEIVRIFSLGEDVKKDGIERSQGSLVVRPVEVNYLIERLTAAATFRRFDQRSHAWVPKDCPKRVAETYLARVSNWRLPILRGVVRAPTLRPDGSVLAAPGYDVLSGLYLDPHGLVDVHLKERPTRDDAVAALNRLAEPFSKFPFVAPSDRATHISAILTALVRNQLRTAPFHLFRAPMASSGKTLLADAVALVATGVCATIVTPGEDEKENSKRVLAILLGGDEVVCFDNIEGNFGSQSLCAVLTADEFHGRLLGFSRMAKASTRLTWLGTGNNVAVVGDLTRRTLPCDIDPQCEHPERREFQGDLRKDVVLRRAELVACGLTILRAYIQSGRPDQGLGAFGSFEEWSNLVRSALVWAGESDPCEGQKRLESIDPERARTRLVFMAWNEVVGGRTVSAKEVLGFAAKSARLREALEDVAAGPDNKLNARRLGHWLLSRQNSIEAGLRLERAGDRQGAALWRVVRGFGGVGGNSPTQRAETVGETVNREGVKEDPQNPQNPPTGEGAGQEDRGSDACVGSDAPPEARQQRGAGSQESSGTRGAP